MKACPARHILVGTLLITIIIKIITIITIIDVIVYSTIMPTRHVLG